MATPLDYSNVIGDLRAWYGVSSEEVWNVINQYNLTPEQLYNLAPNNYLGQGADGLYHIFLNNGESAGVYQQTTIPINQQSSAASAINSNAQNGTVSDSIGVKWAGNSVIDEHGNIRTSPGVNKYSGGSLLGKAASVVGAVNMATAGWSVGMALGKTITRELYKANPTFFSAYNPENWNNITANMPDGAVKKAINYLLQIDNNGNTQAYMPQQAFSQIALALTKQGMFEQAGEEYTWDDAPSTSPVQQPLIVARPIGDIFYGNYNTAFAGWTEYNITGITPSADNVYAFYVRTNGSNHFALRFLNDNDYDIYVQQHNRVIDESGNVKHQYDPSITHVYPHSSNSITATLADYPASLQPYSLMAKCNNIALTTNSNAWVTAAFNIIHNGTKHTSTSLPGTGDQQGAVVPNLPSNSSQQDVDNYIAANYPDLYNNRMEQDVVNPDGTTKTIVYYPVPMPNDTTDTTTEQEHTTTIQDEVEVILPKDASITLPNGTTVRGDGVSRLTLPPGTYTLPAGTTVTNNYIYNEDNTQGSSQTTPAVNDSSTKTLLNLIVKMLSDANPKHATDPRTDKMTDVTSPNPTDVGDGKSPTIIVPVGSASALWSVYNPTQAEINSLGAWLWSNNFVDQLLKMFNDPMQAIIGLHKTYIPPITGDSQSIKVGYLDSGVSSLTIPSQYSSIDCGTVSLKEYFGNVFDYSPYTRVFIFLPFIGFKELDVSQVMRSSINVRYTADAFTGACLAEIRVTRDAESGGVLYSFGGDCAVRYPLSHGSYMGIVNGLIGVAASAGMALGGMMNPIMGVGSMIGSAMNARTKVEVSGGYSGNTGAMGGKIPYLVIMRPQTAMARQYPHYTGIPANHTTKLKDAIGYVRVKEIHVEDISIATDAEKKLIESLLKSGVIV